MACAYLRRGDCGEAFQGGATSLGSSCEWDVGLRSEARWFSGRGESLPVLAPWDVGGVRKAAFVIVYVRWCTHCRFRAWIPSHKLDPFTVLLARRRERIASNAILADAWKEVRERYEKFGDQNDLDYWKDKLLADKIGKGFDAHFRVEPTSNLGSQYPKGNDKRKREGPSKLAYPWGNEAGEEIDDEESDSFLAPAIHTGTKIKTEFEDIEDDDNLFRDLSPPRSISSGKRSKLGSIGNFPARLGSPFGGYRRMSALGSPARAIKQEKGLEYDTSCLSQNLADYPVNIVQTSSKSL